MEPDYKCSQDELYEGAELLATSLTEELAKMADFKAKYDATFVTDFINTITKAKNLPDDDQRVAAHEILRINLVKAVDTDIKNALNSLRLYIRDAYPDDDEYKVRLREAGYDDYDSAMKYNWEKLKGELKNANDFISNHLTQLTDNNNMPPTFQTLITDIKTQIDATVTQFLNLRENSKQGTQQKIIANNEVNKIKNSICEDGQHVFRTDDAKRAQFTWESILEIVSPPGRASLRFDVKEQGTNQPLSGALAQFQKEGGTIITATTDSDGKALIDSIEVGIYNGTISLTDFDPLKVQFQIHTGVTSFKHWLLTKPE